MTKTLLTADEISVLFHCKRRTAIRKAASGEWPAHRSGRTYLYDLDEVREATRVKASEKQARPAKPTTQPRQRRGSGPAIPPASRDFEPLRAREIQRRRSA